MKREISDFAIVAVHGPVAPTAGFGPPQRYVIAWTERCEAELDHYSAKCHGCGALAPPPTQDQLVDAARAGRTLEYGSRHGHPANVHPPGGWSSYLMVLICSGCRDALDAFWSSRREVTS